MFITRYIRDEQINKYNSLYAHTCMNNIIYMA